ncbi:MULTISPECIES: helix-turn-helix domain-containing protein [unclassified Rhodococcus (in: high G+C Gram-positive bacteria)]|nr:MULTISPECIES: helix-turn-helix transcriptional regulator [unclassified Rhodococcus (in: high G+C Gram-positive bacteria)]MBY6480113.1 helix-turn-helix domain-containing protein [Rhodococcus sp. BP-266]
MQDHRRFSDHVRERRRQLGLTRVQVRDRGGPSEPTLTKIERAELAEPTPATLAKLDVGLGWVAGSAARLLSGGNVRTVEGNEASSAQFPDVGHLALDVAAVAQLVSVSTRITELADGRPEDRELRGVANDLSAALHPIYGKYVTQLFEANRRDGKTVSPVFAIFGHLLDEPNRSNDPAEFEERQYRRWLAGRTSGIDHATSERFARRLKASNSGQGEVSE